jgi:hypothetical protein
MQADHAAGAQEEAGSRTRVGTSFIYRQPQRQIALGLTLFLCVGPIAARCDSLLNAVCDEVIGREADGRYWKKSFPRQARILRGRQRTCAFVIMSSVL